MKRESKDTHIYFPPAVFKNIKKLAAENRRSVSAEIVIAVENHILDYKIAKKTDKRGG